MGGRRRTSLRRVRVVGQTGRRSRRRREQWVLVGRSRAGAGWVGRREGELILVQRTIRVVVFGSRLVVEHRVHQAGVHVALARYDAHLLRRRSAVPSRGRAGLSETEAERAVRG